MPYTSWIDVLRSTKGFGLVSLSIDMRHIHAYSNEKAYAGATPLFCRSLGPHIKALVEHAVWSCKRQMHPVIYLGAHIVTMFCEFPKYIGWGLTGQPTWWLEARLHMVDLHTGQIFPVFM